MTVGGRDGVQLTARYLRDVPFVAAWTSPLGRARTTSQMILSAHPGVPLAAHEGLREFGFGEFEALPELEMYRHIAPDLLYRDILAGTFAGRPGGETGRDFLGRVATAFGEIERAHPDGGDVLVVSHGVTLLAYLGMVDAPLRPLPNACVSTVLIQRDGRRVAGEIGIDTAGDTVGPTALEFAVTRVPLEVAATWTAVDSVRPSRHPLGSTRGTRVC